MINLKATKATRIQLFSFSTPQMRAFHLAWMAFFACFFAWFAVAPLMPVIKGEFGLSKDQIANINVASVGITVLVRLLIGPMADKYGPRRVHTALLAFGSIPVLGIAVAHSYGTFLFFRLLIGGIGASFVITQYHTSVMFAPNVVGTANAASAGWGNSGGGVTQSVMPWVLAAVVSLGVGSSAGWRLSMIVPACLMLVVAALYWKCTQDCPQGDYVELRALGVEIESGKKGGWAVFKKAMGNYRAWMLFVTYGACFGVELFVHNVAASYYVDRYKLDLQSAGMAAGSFGLLALFARAVGGIISDRVARTKGLGARTNLLFVLMLGEGLGLLWFSPDRHRGHGDRRDDHVWAVYAHGLRRDLRAGAVHRSQGAGRRGRSGRRRRQRGRGLGRASLEAPRERAGVLRRPRRLRAPRSLLRRRHPLLGLAQGAREHSLREGPRRAAGVAPARPRPRHGRGVAHPRDHVFE